MKINPKVTGALAWTGLVVVLAIPAANMLTGEPEARVNLTSDTQQVKTATAAPAAKPAAKPVVPSVETKPAAAASASSGDPVADFVKSGKKLPSYISGNDAPVVNDVATTPAAPVKKPGTITINPDGTIQKPATTVPAPSVTPAQPEVASIKPQLVAPIPLPASARPKPQLASQPQTVTALPVPAEQPPLIIDESTVAATGPVPPANVGPEPVITGDQLEEWDSGSLADYLARKGLISDASTATPPQRDYDPDGFFLDEGPNNDRRRSRVIIY